MKVSKIGTDLIQRNRLLLLVRSSQKKEPLVAVDIAACTKLFHLENMANDFNSSKRPQRLSFFLF